MVLRSQDGGRRWSYAAKDPRRSFFSIVRAANHPVAVGEKGLVRISSDGGRTWAEPTVGDIPATVCFLRVLDFDAAREVGYTLGQDRIVLRSDDA